MKYIKANQFLSQSKDVQNKFLNWWKPSIGDLYTYTIENEQDYSEVSCVTSLNVAKQTERNKGVRIPLLTEGQLRKFIEEYTKSKVMIEYTSCRNIVIKTCIEDEVTGSLRYNRKFIFPTNKFNLINSYWQVAINIVKEQF